MHTYTTEYIDCTCDWCCRVPGRVDRCITHGVFMVLFVVVSHDELSHEDLIPTGGSRNGCEVHTYNWIHSRSDRSLICRCINGSYFCGTIVAPNATNLVDPSTGCYPDPSTIIVVIHRRCCRR